MSESRVEKLPIVSVTWLDSKSDGRWGFPETYAREAGIAECESIGFMLSKTKRCVTIVQSRSFTTGHVNDSISIPLGCIKRIRRLR